VANDDTVCCLCDRVFVLRGAAPRRLVIEDDGESLMIVAGVCPECEVTRRAEIDAQVRAYEHWRDGRRPA
jgi:hypothetical protein